ncbi:MAG: hypothetical protein JO305_05470 [Alphaproteobacteria bacterium]|nr:hypothetical protein [Alphaproteobacteria bacterium]
MSDRVQGYALIAGCVVFAAAIVFELLSPVAADVAVPVAAAPVETGPKAAARPGGRPEELLAAALARPLFSPSRRPPERGEASAAATADLGNTRLTGIVTEPDRRWAIFAVAGARPQRVAEGETVAGWHIESIAPGEVTLTGPGGAKTLQPKLDPNLTVAVAAAPAVPPGLPPGLPLPGTPPSAPGILPRTVPVGPGPMPPVAAPNLPGAGPMPARTGLPLPQPPGPARGRGR